ncbi:MAG: DUF4097 family beta strand repeat-containing protein [Xanthomonadales bacterium]|nr:DUF4097 family beta strand repeat-containing protein [Xanthomonadales bacterium]
MRVGYLKIMAVFMMLASASAFAGKSVDESWELDADATVFIENIAGVIEIRGWDKNEARLTGELGSSADELEISSSGSSLQISVTNRSERNVDETVLKLIIPEGASVDATAVSADIMVKGLDNEKLTASSVSGNVEVSASSRRVSIESVSGDVEFSGQTVRITAESVSGDIDLSGVSGEVSATTVSGDMDLMADQIESGRFETVSGDMTIVAEVSGNGKIGAESMSGDVVIMLPASQSGVFKAQSFSGRISTDFGSVDRAKHGPGSHLKHVAGDGGAEVRVESFSGDIKLKHD